MANCTLNKYFSGGQPQYVGNQKAVRALLNGPNPYVAGGVGIPKLAGVNNITKISVCLNSAVYFCVVEVAGTKDKFAYSDVKLIFSTVADGAEAGGIDLSAVGIRIEVTGTN